MYNPSSEVADEVSVALTKVEGAELACLEGIDWSVVSIDTILVEGNEAELAKQ